MKARTAARNRVFTARHAAPRSRRRRRGGPGPRSRVGWGRGRGRRRPLPVVLAGQHQHEALDAGRARREGVRLGVADEERGGQVDAVFLGRLEEEAGPGLAAGARIGRRVRAVVGFLDARPVGRERRLERVIHPPQVVGGHQPLGDALLVGDHENRQAGLVQRAHARRRPGEQGKLRRGLDVVAGQVDVQHPVPVQEHGGAAGQSSPLIRSRSAE